MHISCQKEREFVDDTFLCRGGFPQETRQHSVEFLAEVSEVFAKLTLNFVG